MSDGEKVTTMEKKLIIAANYRQSSPGLSTAAEFRRDGSSSGSSISSRNSTQNAAARREYSANSRESNFGRGGRGGQAPRKQPLRGDGGGKGRGRQGGRGRDWDGGTGYKGVDNNNIRDNQLPQYSDDFERYDAEVASAGLNEGSKLPPELGSVQAWGPKKKSNYNYLLNFHVEGSHHHDGVSYHGGYGTRGYAGTGRQGGGGKRGYGGQKNRVRSGGSICYNKERFLQANCQFVVRERGNYSLHGHDPDLLVEWDLIEQVRVRSYEVQSCPICLYPPTAAKITRCGHVYCWVCMLRYLAVNDKTWSKCPICYEAVHEKDLKSVMAIDSHEYGTGEQITMRLMKKARGELQVAPRNDWRGWSGKPCTLQDDVLLCVEGCLSVYSKLITADMDEVRSVLRYERIQLQAQLIEEGEHTLEGSFVKAALKLLEEREAEYDSVNQTEPHPFLVNDNQSEVRQTFESDVPMSSVIASTKPAKCYRSAFDDEVEEEVMGVGERGEVEGLRGRESSGHSESSTGDSESEGQQQQQQSDGENGANVGLDAGESCGDVDKVNVESMAAGAVGGSDDAAAEAAEETVGGAYGAAEAAVDNVGGAYLIDEAAVDGKEKDDAFYFYQADDGQQIYMNPLNIRCLLSQYGSLAHAPDTITATILELETVSMDEDTRRRLRVLSHLPVTCQFMMAELDLRPPLVSTQVLSKHADEIDRRARVRQRKEREDKQRARRIQQEENRKLGIDPTVRVIRSDYKKGVAMQQKAGSDSALVQMSGSYHSSSPPVSDVSPSNASPDWTVGSYEGGSSNTGSTALSFAQMLKAGQQRPPPMLARQDHGGQGHAVIDSEADGDGGVVVPKYQESWAISIAAALDNLKAENGDAEENGEIGGKGKKKKNAKKLLFTTTMARYN